MNKRAELRDINGTKEQIYVVLVHHHEYVTLTSYKGGVTCNNARVVVHYINEYKSSIRQY
jgi:hypothetical protein